MLYSLKTHPELLHQRRLRGGAGHTPWPMGLALATLAGVTVLVALVVEIFVESVQKAAEALGMTPGLRGFHRRGAGRRRRRKWPPAFRARARTGWI